MIRLAAMWAITAAAGCSHLAPVDPTQLRSEAVRYLEWYCLDDSAAIRVRALEALSDTSTAEAVQRFRYALSDDYWGVRFEACVGLGEAHEEDAMPLLRERLQDSHDAVRAAAIWALHRMTDQSHTSELASLLLEHEDAAVRRLTAQLLGRLGEPKSMVLLTRAARDRDQGVRWEATAAMARLGNEKAVQQLVYSAHSGFSDRQTFALLELALLAEPKCESLFRYRLEEGPHAETRLVAARGLGRLGQPDGLRLALELLRFDQPDPSPEVVKVDPPQQQIGRVRTMAALALGDIGDESALGALAQVMRTDAPEVRVAAAKAIVEIVDRRSAGSADSGGAAQ
jgi:HEAT repeat protein